MSSRGGPRLFRAASKPGSGNKMKELLELTRPGPVLWAVLTLEADMDGIIYLVGLIVIVMAVLSLFGLR